MESKSLALQVTLSKYLVLLAIIGAVSLYCYKFGWWTLLNERDAWGQFGDFFGGVLNPLISFGAFYWLATSILLQKAELSETRDALKATQFAQQQHADTALVAAKIQRDNILLTMVANKIAALRTRQTHILQMQADRGPYGKYYDEHGQLTPLVVALKKLNEEISSLESEEAEVFGKIAQQSREFRQEVAPGYAS
jgi:hypothetical protein